MKNFRHYLTESVRTYKYKVKIAGEPDAKFMQLLTANLAKFDPVKIGEPKSTPVQKSPYGFPDLENEPVHIIKAEFRYPATEPMIQQIAQLLGYNVNYVRVVGTNFDDSINSESEAYANEASHSPVLDHEELEEQPGAKEAAKAYGNSYLDSIQDQMKGNTIDIPYEGKKTPNAFDPFKPETQMATMGKESPMSKISRPAKPQTGAMGGK